MANPFSTITIPNNVSVIPVDTRGNSLKVLYLPTVSTNQGRFLMFKDYYGTASNSSFTISTTGTDLIDDYNCLLSFSNAFGSVSLLADGGSSWRTIGMYDGLTTPAQAGGGGPIVTTSLVLNLDAGTYTSGTSWAPTVGNTWTLYNSPTTAICPGGSNVFVFNGSSYAMDQTGIANSLITSFTMDMWINPTQDGVLISEMGQGGGPNNGYHTENMGLVGGNVLCGYWCCPFSYSLGAYTVNKWLHVVYTYDNSTGNTVGYLNGIQTASGNSSKSPPGTSFFAMAAAEGTSFGNSSGYNGQIGAYKIYGIPLTAAQVKQNYNALASRFGLPNI